MANNLRSLTSILAANLRSLTSILAALTWLSACGGGGGGDSNSPDSQTNIAPTAFAGTPQSVLTGSTVGLTGSGTDSDGDTITYAWTLIRPSGSAATLNSESSPNPFFISDKDGTYTAFLMVSDGKAVSAPSSVTITSTAQNAAPVANAGTLQNVAVGSVVTLDGSGSADANGDVISYKWSLTSLPVDSNAVLSNAGVEKPTFIADRGGNYFASLIVSDGKVDSLISTVTVNAAISNVAPIANAGAGQAGYIGDKFTLDGTNSSDANGGALVYIWAVTSYPDIFAPTLLGASTARPTFTASSGGTYVFSLKVSDGIVESVASTVSVTVINGVGPAPAGTGLVVQNSLNFYAFDEISMTKTVDFNCGHGYSAIDQAVDGVILGVDSSSLWEISTQTGRCVMRGPTPGWLIGIAVSSAGDIYGVSFTLYQVTNAILARRLYRVSSNGSSLSYVEISGDSSYLTAIDFGPDGKLYAIGIVSGGGWGLLTVNPTSGMSTKIADLPVRPDGDIDIDGNGVLRGVSNGDLVKINLTTGVASGAVPIPGFSPSFSLSPILYIP